MTPDWPRAVGETGHLGGRRNEIWMCGGDDAAFVEDGR